MAFERLLEADPAELAGRSDSELTRHLRECERCAAVAARLLEGQAALTDALDAMGPRVEVERALRAVANRTAAVPWRARVWRWSVPLAAAAAVGALFVLRVLSQQPAMRGEIVPVPAARFEALVEAPEAKNVMVFETRDESVKVIWFY